MPRTATPAATHCDAQGSVRVDYGFNGGARIGSEVFGSGTREDFDGRLPGYGLVHLVGSLPFGERWRVGLRVENLLDRNYEVLSGYNTPGRGAYVTLADTDSGKDRQPQFSVFFAPQH